MRRILILILCLVTAPAAAQTWSFTGNDDLVVDTQTPLNAAMGTHAVILGNAWSPNAAVDNITWGALDLRGCTQWTLDETTGATASFTLHVNLTEETCTWQRLVYANNTGSPVVTPTIGGTIEAVRLHDAGELRITSFWLPVLVFGAIYTSSFLATLRGGPNFGWTFVMLFSLMALLGLMYPVLSMGSTNDIIFVTLGLTLVAFAYQGFGLVMKRRRH